MEKNKYAIGMCVQMKKKHPCGSDRWTITRVGMDIGLCCCGCGHCVLLPRAKFAKMVKRLEPVEQEKS